MRNLDASETQQDPITENFRPVCQRHGRIVRKYTNPPNFVSRIFSLARHQLDEQLDLAVWQFGLAALASAAIVGTVIVARATR